MDCVFSLVLRQRWAYSRTIGPKGRRRGGLTRRQPTRPASALLGAGPERCLRLGGVDRGSAPGHASDGGDVRGSEAWVSLRGPPSLFKAQALAIVPSLGGYKLLSLQPGAQVSSPVGPTVTSIALLTRVFRRLQAHSRDSALPPSRPRARPPARPLVPSPCSRPSSRCPGGRRPLAPLLLPPPGRE